MTEHQPSSNPQPDLLEMIKQWSRDRYLKWKALWQKFRHNYPRGSQVVKWSSILGISGVAVLFIFCLSIYWGAFGALPTYGELSNIRNNTASEVYAEDGVLLGKYYVENRVNADFEEISEDVINALVATEDARFFEHNGIDIRAWGRVLVKSILLSDDSSGGGSTISQQLAKNLYPRRDYFMLSTFINKLRETFVARRLENTYTKEELLNLYLNTVPFGDDIYGIKVASQRFFSKSPHELTLPEAAVLVGMLKANSYYHPVRHPERAQQRRNTVMAQMVRYNYLDPTVYDTLKVLPVEATYVKEGKNRGLATYFREHLRQKVEELLKGYYKKDGTPYNLNTDGLKIYTSIDAALQQYAERAVEENMPVIQANFDKNWKKRTPWDERLLNNAVEQSRRYQALKAQGKSKEEILAIFEQPVQMRVFGWEENSDDYRDMSPMDSIKHYLTRLNTGLMAMEPHTGLIRAWVGGNDFGYFQYDHVKSRRQVGSTFKPVVYLEALQQGMMPCEYTPNELVTYEDYDNWQPHNSDGEYGGVYSLEGALSHSVNTVTVEILMRSGIEPVRELAKKLGISSDIPKVPSIALGTVEASLFDMVQVYGTFANEGMRPEIHYLDRIETSDGEVLMEFERPEPKNFEQVVSREHNMMLVKMLESVVDSGTARKVHYGYGLYGDIAGKTGTTQNQSDGWFLGFVPNLVAGVWVGAESPRVHFRTMSAGQGSSTALPIWGSFMRSMYKDKTLANKYRKGKFPEMADTLMATMLCPPYLEEMPILAEWGEENYYEIQDFYQMVQEYNQDALRKVIEMKPRRENETYQEYGERIERFYDREQRRRENREQRKEFWSKFLFGKKKENEDKEKPNGGGG